MGFESSLPEDCTATPVSTDTQLITTSGLTPASQQEAMENLSQIQGVLDVRENLPQTGLTVTFVPSLTSVKKLSEAVTILTDLETQSTSSHMKKDLNVSPSHAGGGGVAILKLSIEGMTCHSCTTTIEGKIGKLKGIEKIKGNVFFDKLVVRYNYTV